jgi:hypothetical protein
MHSVIHGQCCLIQPCPIGIGMNSIPVSFACQRVLASVPVRDRNGCWVLPPGDRPARSMSRVPMGLDPAVATPNPIPTQDDEVRGRIDGRVLRPAHAPRFTVLDARTPSAHEHATPYAPVTVTAEHGLPRLRRRPRTPRPPFASKPPAQGGSPSHPPRRSRVRAAL